MKLAWKFSTVIFSTTTKWSDVYKILRGRKSGKIILLKQKSAIMKTANQDVADEMEAQCEKIVLKTENN